MWLLWLLCDLDCQSIITQTRHSQPSQLFEGDIYKALVWQQHEGNGCFVLPPPPLQELSCVTGREAGGRWQGDRATADTAGLAKGSGDIKYQVAQKASCCSACGTPPQARCSESVIKKWSDPWFSLSFSSERNYRPSLSRAHIRYRNAAQDHRQRGDGDKWCASVTAQECQWAACFWKGSEDLQSVINSMWNHFTASRLSAGNRATARARVPLNCYWLYSFLFFWITLRKPRRWL